MSTSSRRTGRPGQVTARGSRAGRSQVQTALARLRQRHGLRWHVLAIALLVLATLVLAGALWRAAGVQGLALRWALALPVAYVAYLALLRLWAQALLDDNAQADIPDPGDMLNHMPGRGSGAHDPAAPVGGGGGDFGGAGAGGTWDEPVASLPDAVGDALGETASRAIDGAGALLDGADEAAIVVIPAALVLGVLALLASLMGTGLWMLFGVDVLLAVVAELLLASLAGAMAYKGAREGWLAAAMRHTWRGALASWVLAVALGWWLPQASSLPHALRLLLA